MRIALVLAAGLALLAAAPLRAGETAIGTIELSGEAAQEAKAACDNSSLPGSPGGGIIKRYKLTFMSGHTEYDPETCKPHGPGSWVVADQGRCNGQTCGKLTTGIISNYPLKSGPCAGKTYDFGAICYTWTTHDNLVVHDNVTAIYVPPQISPVTEKFRIRVPVVTPTGDTSKFDGWHSTGLGLWNQKLYATKDPGFDWTGGITREIDPGTSKQSDDTCWCQGSTILPFYKISGGQWRAEPSGAWGADGVGWNNDAVDYYRKKRRAPCGTKFPQQMQFIAEDVSNWEDYAKVNSLGGSFTYQQVTSFRAGKTATRTYKAQPTKSRLACNRISFDAPPLQLGGETMVDDPRPLWAAAAAITRATGRAISYEDAPVAEKSGLTPMVVRGDGDKALLMPKGGALAVKLPNGAGAEETLAAAKSAVAAYAAGKPSAAYEVRQSGGMIQIVPTAAADASGRLAPVVAALDRKVTLAERKRSGLDLLDELRTAVAEAGGTPVLIGSVPADALARLTVDFGAANQPAREVLATLVAALKLNASWSLLYDPGTKDFALNLTAVD